MNLFELFVKIGVDDEASEKVEGISKKFKTGLANAGKVAAAGIGLVTGAAVAAGGALLGIEAATEEYRIAQGKLNTAFEAAGYSADTAKQAYTGFYEILGDTDTATEASQLLAKLAQNEEDMSEWTNIAAGVWGTFGDSLPIEGLIESANETAKTGTVVGTLADALNWAGISEDDFNKKLASAGSEAERNQLIMNTLAGEYDTAADAFYRNNEALIDARNAQAKMDEALGKLGESVSNIKSKLMGEFLPGISAVTEGLAGMLSGTEGADEQFSNAIGGLINTAVSRLPEFLNFGVQILSSIMIGVVQNIPTLVSAIPEIIMSMASAFESMWPTIQDAGSQLLSMLGNGIITYVPTMIGQLPAVIVAIINFLTQNMPIFLQKGTEFIVNLINGITKQIPGMVAQLPQLITAFVSFIAANIPQITQSGVQILLSLASGIIQSIPSLVAQLPQIISAIMNGIYALIASVVEAGANIVRGLWEGISGMAGWIAEKVSGFIGGIIDGAKNLLGIHSPSTVFADMGKNMALGLGKGWENSFHDIQKSISDNMDFGTASVSFASSGVGAASAGMVNSIASAGSQNNGPYVFNLVLPDGTQLARYILDPLIDVAKANGTPILNPI